LMMIWLDILEFLYGLWDICAPLEFA